MVDKSSLKGDAPKWACGFESHLVHYGSGGKVDTQGLVPLIYKFCNLRVQIPSVLLTIPKGNCFGFGDFPLINHQNVHVAKMGKRGSFKSYYRKMLWVRPPP